MNRWVILRFLDFDDKKNATKWCEFVGTIFGALSRKKLLYWGKQHVFENALKKKPMIRGVFPMHPLWFYLWETCASSCSQSGWGGASGRAPRDLKKFHWVSKRSGNVFRAIFNCVLSIFQEQVTHSSRVIHSAHVVHPQSCPPGIIQNESNGLQMEPECNSKGAQGVVFKHPGVILKHPGGSS